jgi:hypothetical protein
VRPFALRSLPAAVAPQLAAKTVETVEPALEVPAVEAAPEPAVAAETVAAEPAVAPGPTAVAEPVVVAEPETAAEALAAVAEPAPAAEQTAIAKAAGKGSARAAVVPHPSSAPVETIDIAQAPKLVTPAASSKRRK